MTEKINFNTVFESFNQFNILIIGDVMIDSYMWGKVNRISPEAPVPIIMSTKQENRLGGAANVALNVQALGANPILCAVIGKDSKAKSFYNLLKENKLSGEGILEDESRKTTVKTRIISNNQHLLRVDEEVDHELDKKIEKTFIQHILSIMSKKQVNAIIFEDYDKGCITPLVIKEIVEFANKKNIPTLVDPKKRNFSEYKNVTLFKPNFKELVEGSKIDIKKGDFDGVFKASEKLHDELSVKYLLVTLSELGVFISYNKSYKTIPAEVRDIADVSGAGDTIISIASVCLASGLNAELIAGISNLAGGLVCEKVGVVPIDKTQLLKETIEKFS
ncbi:MAG: carbohydrate kinase [Bacteroidetes bacterium GWC2_33_15]|nr:MAG: carbohydrate kinase [Bacteroidetes bacterium GWA2_33_15]OFX52479.1 MAG: carbohydrate kinase [Bacteroidetes bacterium GWC2_33_15]OFX65540.1 MAG: carbohydrate kinase [Bacteroidetes bacterium GWB2_32_14]OFX67561.1 MAG: carbohydrate kinase [Bacteroidetes bacterium GWD2_33_33]HAN18396.1 D-glycero-beta-D-manno-heptose-7-phosphate kinase [Bacteroidales bacterium]